MKPISICITGIFLMTSMFLKAQGIEKTNVIDFISSTYKSLATVDIDNNGVIDLVTANEQILWFEGTGSTDLGPSHLLDIDFTELIYKLFIEDINSDGYDDIYYYLGPWNYVVGLLLNPGVPGGEWEQYTMPSFYSDVVGFFDMDGDGAKDFIFEDYLGHLGYRKNEGNTFDTYLSIPDTYPDLFFYSFTDIDQDGDTDWVGYFDDCCTKFFRNNSNGSFTVVSTSSDEYMSNIFTVDINNDGYSDIVYFTSGTGYEVSYYSPATNTFGSQVYIGSISPYTYSRNFKDIDLDGNLDLVVEVLDTDPDDSYHVYKWIPNPGAGIPFQIGDVYLLPLIPETSYTFNCKGFYDITNDGAPDLLINASDDTGDRLLIYENDLPSFHSPDSLELPFAPVATEILCFDIDADPDNDLIMGFDNGTLGWLEFDHLADSFTVFHEILHLPGYDDVINIKKKDLDNDGDFDLITSFLGAATPGITYYSLNDGEGNFTNYLLGNLAFLNIWLMDADEDGDLDFTAMMRNTEHNLVYYENTGITDAMFVYGDDVSSLAVWNTFVDIDIDEDGDMDMIGGRDYTSQVKSFINEDGAGAFTVQSNYFTAECNDVRSLFASDFDNDGDQDIVYTCELGEMYLSRNDDGVHTQISIGTFDPTMIADGSHTALFDLNMDGFEDLIYNKITGGSGYKLATGPGTFDDNYTAFSEDYGRFNNVDGGTVPDFVGIDEKQVYVQYNILMLAPSFTISNPTTSYLEEGGMSDSLIIDFDEIPQSTLTINIDPSGTVDAGAGVGVPISINIPNDPTALEPIVIHFTIPDDTLVEDVSTGIISIQADPDSWGMYAGFLNEYRTYTTVDNDLGIFYSPSTLIFTEGSSSDTVYAHINMIPSENVSIHIIPNPAYNSGFDALLIDEQVLSSGINAITPFKCSANTENNNWYTGDINTGLQFQFSSADPDIDGFTPDEIPVIITENDTFGLQVVISTTELSEGIETADMEISLQCAPMQDVSITLSPNLYLDLGNGPGGPIFLNFIANGLTPATQIISVFAVDDYLAEGTHLGTVEVFITTEDTLYGGITPENYIFSISDNDMPQGITFVPPAATTYLEGTTDITMNVALWTNPIEIVNIVVHPEPIFDLGAGPGNDVTITFDPLDDATIPQNINASIVNNTDIGPATMLAYITFEIITTDPILFDATIETIELTVQDEDMLQSIQVAAPAPITYTEGEDAITMSVMLNTIPNSAVTINCIPNDQLDLGAGVGIPMTLLLEGPEATLPHELMISIDDDPYFEGPHTGSITFEVITDDPVVIDMTIPTVELAIDDNDFPQSVVVSYDALYHEEGETSIPISIALESVPGAPVDILLSPGEDVDLGAGNGIPVNVHFNADATATIPQTLLFSIGDNFIVEGDHSTMILFDITTFDPVLIDYEIPAVTVYIHDNDALQGVNISSPEVTPYTEGTLDIPIAVSLFTTPNAPVSIIADYDMDQITMTTSTLNFATDATATESQYFHISVVDDILVEGDHFALINYTIVTDDPQFDGYSIPFAIVNIADNDIESAIHSVVEESLPSVIMTSGQFEIHVSDAFNGSTFVILSMNGQEVSAGKITGNTLRVDTGTLPAGRYALGIMLENEFLQVPLIVTH